MQKATTIFFMPIMLILVACNSPVNTIQPTEALVKEATSVSMPKIEPTPQEMLFPVTGHEQARDAVVAYVAELTGLPLPSGEWVFQDQTGQNSDETLTWLFTNSPWVVQVSAPAIAPQPMEYSVMVDHMSAIIRWEGMVDSFGEIVEENFIQGSLPEPPEMPEESSWIGVVVSIPESAQFDDYFQMMDQNGTRYGIDGADDTLKEQLISYRDTGIAIQVWGNLQYDVPDAYGAQILVTRIEPY